MVLAHPLVEMLMNIEGGISWGKEARDHSKVEWVVPELPRFNSALKLGKTSLIPQSIIVIEDMTVRRGTSKTFLS